MQSSLHYTLWWALLLFLIFRLYKDWIYKNPCTFLQELSYKKQIWFYKDMHNQEHRLHHLKVIFHNPLFQLIKLQGFNDNRWLVLFNDQITKEQCRLLYLLSKNKPQRKSNV